MKQLRIMIFVLMAMCWLSAGAQRKDSIALFKEFTDASISYKKVPLYLQLEYRKISNLFQTDADTATATAEFYITHKGAYIRFGDAEQVINDSMVLIISGSTKQMMLTDTEMPVEEQLKTLSMPALQDSSAEKLAARFRIEKTELGKSRAKIKISGRSMIAGTLLPFESMELVYRTDTYTPELMSTTRRNLVLKPETLATGQEPVLVTVPGRGVFAVKEETTFYVYKKISHDAEIVLPVLMGDRVTKDKDDTYLPVKAYENYNLIKN